MESTPLIHAIGEATDPFAANALAYKGIVISELTKNGAFPSQQARGHLLFGERIPFEKHVICVDILDEFADQTAILVRCLARAERLYVEELAFWEAVAQNEKIRRVLFVHEAGLHPLEDRFIQRLMELYLRVELIHMGVPMRG